MKILEKHESLKDVLNAYVASVPIPNHATLTEWIRRYPQYEKELTEFTVAWNVMNELPGDESAKEVDEATLVLRGMSIVENHLHASGVESKEPRIKSLLAEMKSVGLSLDKMADLCELSVVILNKLNQRLIDYSSIPGKVLNSVARAIRKSLPSVSQYLQQGMTLAEGGRYHSSEAPRVAPSPENFFDAIKNDPSIDEQRRQYWLSLDPRNAKQKGR